MRSFGIFLLIISLVLLSVIALAQSSGGGVVLSKGSFNTGVGMSSNSQLVLKATIGQPEVNMQHSKGGGFILTGGYWAKVRTTGLIFKNGFESD